MSVLSMVIAWVLAMMMAVAPSHREHFEPEAKESFDQADARYTEIATAIVTESMSGPALSEGKIGRIKTAMTVAAWMFYESGFRRDIDLGTSRVRLRKTGLNDFGRSWCLGQINLGTKTIPDPDRKGMFIETSADKTPQGWTGPELLADRRKCVRATIDRMRSSLLACADLPVEERMAQYASGLCKTNPALPVPVEKQEHMIEQGKAISKERTRFVYRWLSKDRPKVNDAQVLQEMKGETPNASDRTEHRGAPKG